MSQNSETQSAKRINADLIVGIVSLGLAALVYFSTRELSKLGGVFVDYTLVALTALALLTTAKGLVKPERIRFFESVVERNNVLVGICILLLYFTTRNILSSAALTVLVVTAFYFIFHDFLEVPLPEGRWFG
jgi:amino acid transporter